MLFKSCFKRKNKIQLNILAERITSLEDRLDKLNTNGVATSINKLNQEVFKKVKETNSRFGFWYNYFGGEPLPKEVTLAAKVDAIVEHLGLKFNVEAEKVSVKKIKKEKK